LIHDFSILVWFMFNRYKFKIRFNLLLFESFDWIKSEFNFKQHYKHQNEIQNSQTIIYKPLVIHAKW